MAKRDEGRDLREGRHGSESSNSNASWRSQATIKDGRDTNHPMRTKKPRSGSSNRHPPQEPQSEHYKFMFPGSANISPMDARAKLPGFGNHRKALAAVDYPGNSNFNPGPLDPLAPWASTPSLPMGTFFNDSSEHETSPLSPAFRPGTGRTVASDAVDSGYDGDHRRPSIASATTVSSQGSKSSHSGTFRKRLQGFFGDEYPGPPDSRHDSDGSLHLMGSRDHSTARARNNSTGSRNQPDRIDLVPSPNPSRPRTPLPSSEVTPWMYQRFNDIPQFGEAPVRDLPISSDRQRFVLGNGNGVSSVASQKDSHKHHFTAHRHSRSKDEIPTSIGPGDSSLHASRAGQSDLGVSLRPRDGISNVSVAMSSSTTLGTRSTSPSPSVQGALYRDSGGQHSPGSSLNKRSLFDKLRRPKVPSPFKQDPFKGSSKTNRREISPARRDRKTSFESFGFDRKDSGKGLTIGPTKLRGRLGLHGHDAGPNSDNGSISEIYLDTNLSDMNGIVSQSRPADKDRIFDGELQPEEGSGVMRHLPGGSWDAPESWQVKKYGEDIVRSLPTIDDDADAAARGEGMSYFIRVFRVDSTFATLSAGLNATVADILLMLGRKSFLQDDLNNYEIVVRKNGLSRQLERGERPLLIQKRLLEQVGYTAADKIEEIGRDDHSYLCRFIFIPTKFSAYSSLANPEGDPAMGKNRVDLEGRSLVAIPPSLYERAYEINSLNLSRNLSLEVPSDFIQASVNLREIKFISNDAWCLPPSISLASRLTLLDVSNNRLEQLDHDRLDRLHGLVSIKMANNKLSTLPSYFGDFKALRSLNLSSNCFQVFPEFLCRLSSLVDLDISFNNIRTLPNIGQLTMLERLWATNNMLSGPLDESFSNLTNINEIDVRFNSVTNVDSLNQLPRLEKLLLGHNAITKVKGSFPKLCTLLLDHCPITEFDLDGPVPTLTSLNIASAKLVQFRDSLFDQLPSVTKLILDKNHFVSLSQHIGKLRKLEHFSIIKNPLSSLPPTIGCLTELKYLNLRECNLKRLPPEIWYCLKLETLNVSSNILDSFPKHVAHAPQLPGEFQLNGTPASTPGAPSTPSYENLGGVEETGLRRPSQVSGGRLSVGSPPSNRNNSVVSNYIPGGRKTSTVSRAYTDGTSASRKDSNFSQRFVNSFAGSLRYLYLADNSLEDDIFRELSLLPELRILNLSYNELTELPQGLLKRWLLLSDLYLSGNELSSLPSDDLEEGSNLKTLHINANRFQVLPAELCKVSKLAILDAGSNSLKYNVSNWPYDWNWNWNRNLKYLNFSGNKRLEIKPNISSHGPSQTSETDLTDFNSLSHLRILGLMDVTLTVENIPEETEDRRVRTSASLTGSLSYGMADFLGKNEHLSIIDMMVPRLRADNIDTLVGLFDGRYDDGQHDSSGGSKIAKFLHENFTSMFSEELKNLQPDTETPLDALRRTFLGLNKDLAAAAYRSIDDREHRYYSQMSAAAKLLNQDDIHAGGIATVLYLRNMDLYVGNVGDAQAVLVKSDASLKYLTRHHDPAESHERARIRAAGGYVSRNGKLNDVLPVSRAFGYFPRMPSVIAAPHTAHFTLTEQDEMIIMASREVWEYVTPDLVVDVARREQRDSMVAAQKIRDLAIAFGASNKLMVMVLGVSDLKKRERLKFRGPSMSMGPASFPEEQIVPSIKRTKKPRDGPGDSRLARFDYVDAPIGELAIIFTDIKKSTALWEACPNAMRSAIQIHNDILRRQLGIIGGYEVKTEGDAFMVAFSTTTAALLWCFNCQTQLLEAEWPTEVLQQPQCKEWYDTDQNLIFRGLSVRMGGHWGEPVCEKDPVTNRMDYFGPMVNRASRISAVADGGEVFLSSDFMSELQRMCEIYADSERSASICSLSEFTPTNPLQNVHRELQQLNSQGFIIKDQGEQKLKGLENPEPVFLICPHALAGRLAAFDTINLEEDLVPTTTAKPSELGVDADLIWRLGKITLRLESLCNYLENPAEGGLKRPNMALFNVPKKRGGELADSTVVSVVEQAVTRIETCVNTLFVRHLISPFKPGDRLEDHANPMGDVMVQLKKQLDELSTLRLLIPQRTAQD
ncbi:hypothetical protein V8E54_005879 [Elaphomyces granulatus]